MSNIVNSLGGRNVQGGANELIGGATRRLVKRDARRVMKLETLKS